LHCQRRSLVAALSRLRIEIGSTLLLALMLAPTVGRHGNWVATPLPRADQASPALGRTKYVGLLDQKKLNSRNLTIDPPDYV
jgi:hypothetical protein